MSESSRRKRSSPKAATKKRLDQRSDPKPVQYKLRRKIPDPTWTLSELVHPHKPKSPRTARNRDEQLAMPFVVPKRIEAQPFLKWVGGKASLLRQTQGFKEASSPMPTYRPDYFGQKQSKSGRIELQVVVEVEIESTIFCKHTEKQILLMHEFLGQQKGKRVKAEGVLALPGKSKARIHASALLTSLFPEGHSIQLLELEV